MMNVKKQFIWIIFLLILVFLGAILHVNENTEEKRKNRVFYLANSETSESEDWIFKHVKEFAFTDTTEGFSTSSTTDITSGSPYESILSDTNEFRDGASLDVTSYTTEVSINRSERNISKSVNGLDMETDEDSSDRSIDTDKEVIVGDEDSAFLHAEVIRKSIYMHKMENYVKPPHESCKRRLPVCIVVGVAKSGTREIIDFMGLHPHIAIYYLKERSYEMPYFSKAYDKGQEWFQSQMPCSYSNQITIIKNAWYFSNSYIPERIKNFNESIKLILLVREPVDRAVSQFTFKHRRDRQGAFSFDDVAIKGDKVRENVPFLVRSIYGKPMENWLKYFNLDQFLIIESDELKYHPATVMTKVEDFLGLGHYISPEMFVLNKEKGYYCIKSNLTESGMACYENNRGRSVTKVSQRTRTKLEKYFRPSNERFFSLIRKTYNW